MPRNDLRRQRIAINVAIIGQHVEGHGLPHPFFLFRFEVVARCIGSVVNVGNKYLYGRRGIAPVPVGYCVGE